MIFLKKYWSIVVVVLPVIILIIIRLSGHNHFKSDARKLAAPSFDQSNTITFGRAGNLKEKLYIIDLDKEKGQNNWFSYETQNIPADSILVEKHFKEIMNHDGRLLLFSSDPGLSAKVWILLSQLGCKNIYILTNDTSNEVLNYKFRPDTLVH